jgi:hypothetical protein
MIGIAIEIDIETESDIDNDIDTVAPDRSPRPGRRSGVNAWSPLGE